MVIQQRWARCVFLFAVPEIAASREILPPCGAFGPTVGGRVVDVVALVVY